MHYFTVSILNMNKEIKAYNNSQKGEDKDICNLLAAEIARHLPEAENKIWHAHPVWFLWKSCNQNA